MDGYGLGDAVLPERRGVPGREDTADRDHGAALPRCARLSARWLHRRAAAGHVQSAPSGAARFRRRPRRGLDAASRRDSRRVGLSRRPDRAAPVARDVRPGAVDQPQPAAGGPDHRGVPAAAGAPGERRAPRRDALRPATGGGRTAALRPTGAHRRQRRAGDRGRRSVLDRLGPAVVRHLDAHAQGPRHHPHPKEPMTLFELQAWLGHRTPSTTQHYAKISPNTLSKAYTEAGYFARNIRTIEVPVDRDAVTAGAAAAGQPWQHYDLGHGWCSYTFFEQCPHRMACARCDFYTPKGTTKAQLLEAKDNLQRMLASIPLTDDERAAVDDGHTAVDALLARLADVPTPAGPTPHELGAPPTVTLLPLVQVTHSDSR